VASGVAIGFLGSFTTYSTYEYESLRLLQEGAWVKAGLNLFGSLVLGLIAVFLGVALGRLLIGGTEP
jgi:CrcB protein